MKPIIFSQKVYSNMIKWLQYKPFEVGGLLGKKQIICECELDINTIRKIGEYYPDQHFYEQTIANWNKKGVEFCGIAHTHINNQGSMSKKDVSYIKAIMNLNRNVYTQLYFPIIISQEVIIFYAFWEKEQIKIKKIDIEIL